MGYAMQTIHLSKAPNTAPEETVKGPLHGELLDLYAAILIVVPLALFLKSLWA
jgi:hypothetical protein